MEQLNSITGIVRPQLERDAAFLQSRRLSRQVSETEGGRGAPPRDNCRNVVIDGHSRAFSRLFNFLPPPTIFFLFFLNTGLEKVKRAKVYIYIYIYWMVMNWCMAETRLASSIFNFN